MDELKDLTTGLPETMQRVGFEAIPPPSAVEQVPARNLKLRPPSPPQSARRR